MGFLAVLAGDVAQHGRGAPGDHGLEGNQRLRLQPRLAGLISIHEMNDSIQRINDQ
jgi:hypothetical protein